MKFFDREYEIQKLREIRDVSHRAAQFTVLTGRRRIGKTSLFATRQRFQVSGFRFQVCERAEMDLLDSCGGNCTHHRGETRKEGNLVMARFPFFYMFYEPPTGAVFLYPYRIYTGASPCARLYDPDGVGLCPERAI